MTTNDMQHAGDASRPSLPRAGVSGGAGEHVPESAALVRTGTRAIAEDLLWNVDRAADMLFAPGDQCSAALILKAEGMVAGLEWAAEIFRAAGAARLRPIAAEGAWLYDLPQPIAEVSGSTRAILAARRSALNLLSYLSGIATITARFVGAIDALSPQIVGTRKMRLGLAPLETYAVTLAGGLPSPACDPSVVWVKKTHHDLMGGIGIALQALGPIMHPHELHVECQSLAEVQAALAFAVKRLVLDNMTCDQLCAAVALVNAERGRGTVALEATGNITLASLPRVIATGVDYISVGALTKNAHALDISLEVTGSVRGCT